MNIQLLEAVKNNDLEIVKFLISSGYNINIEDNYYKTPLMYASENGYLDIVKYLINNECERGDNPCKPPYKYVYRYLHG